MTQEADAPTTDATFRYNHYDWRMSNGDIIDYEFVTAQQPAGGATARNARAAVEEDLPRPVSGRTVVLVPSVSLICSGKEEMRPLATLLSQRGHRCYILEWPGWTSEAQVNKALVRLKLPELYAEYVDFWSQILEHVAEVEAADAERAAKAEDVEDRGEPQLHIVCAGVTSVYLLRALQAVRSWSEGRATKHYRSMVMISPTWQTTRYGLWAKLDPASFARWFGLNLHGESRFNRYMQSCHYGKRRFKRHFEHYGVDDGGRLKAVAEWLWQRPRAFIQTDCAALGGFLDPPSASSSNDSSSTLEAPSLAKEVAEVAQWLDQGIMVMAPKEGSGYADGEELSKALRSEEGVDVTNLEETSKLPHEIATSNVHFLLEQWMSVGKKSA